MRFLRPLMLRWPSTRGGHGVDPVRRFEGGKQLPGRPLDGIRFGARQSQSVYGAGFSRDVLSVGKVPLRLLPPIRFLRANIPNLQG